MISSRLIRLVMPPSPTDRNLSSWPEGAPAPRSGSISAAGALPRLFNQRERHAGRRAIDGQSVRLSANSPRPERRSTDGQMILTVTPAGRKPRLDLLVCGAPLRNRTVDLLLPWEMRKFNCRPMPARDGPSRSSRTGPAWNDGQMTVKTILEQRWITPIPIGRNLRSGKGPASHQAEQRMHGR
jgi:hypothetical protein